MEKSLFEQMGGTYHQEGDYFLPDLSVPELPAIGIWDNGGGGIWKNTVRPFIRPCYYLAN